MKFVYVTRQGDDLFPVRDSMEAAIMMVMQRALIFKQDVQTIDFDHEATTILLHDAENYGYVEYIIERVPFHQSI